MKATIKAFKSKYVALTADGAKVRIPVNVTAPSIGAHVEIKVKDGVNLFVQSLDK